MRISLKDLLGIVAFCALVLWCASMAGFTSTVFWVGVSISTIMSVAFIAKARKRRFGSAIGLAIAIAFVGLMLWLITPLINAGALIVLGIALSSRVNPTSDRVLIAATATAALIAIFFGAFPSNEQVRAMHAPRNEFPIVSLDKRLAYETNRKRGDQIIYRRRRRDFA